jgi:hypothetical protein
MCTENCGKEYIYELKSLDVLKLIIYKVCKNCGKVSDTNNNNFSLF